MADQKVIYVVGSTIQSLAQLMKTESTDPKAITPIVPRFYRDTRGEKGYGGSSDIFTSSLNPFDATKYTTHEAAVDWNNEFLDGHGIIYRF